MRTSKEKIDMTVRLLQEDKTYREIQDALKQKFHSSISNSTIRKIAIELYSEASKDLEIARLKKEVQIFKNLYFELLEKVEKLDNAEKIDIREIREIREEVEMVEKVKKGSKP